MANMSNHKELSEIATRLLLIQATSTSVERSSSRQGFIHRKERNLLCPKTVNKLMFIHFNKRFLFPDCDIIKYDIVQPDDAEIVYESDPDETDIEDDMR